VISQITQYERWEHSCGDYYPAVEKLVLRDMGVATEWGDFELSARGLESFNNVCRPLISWQRQTRLLKASDALYEREQSS